MIENFWDEKEGGFFLSGKTNEELIHKTKELYDGALPSGNSVALSNLLRLGRITENDTFEKMAERMIKIFSETVRQYPSGYTQFLCSFDFALGPAKEIVIAGNFKEDGTQQMLKAIWSRFLPKKVLLLHPEKETSIENIAKFTTMQKIINGKATAYICKNHTCKKPTNDINKMIQFLEQ